jgi:TetR/AcrR family transcriptional regulator, copper-responsive repressor
VVQKGSRAETTGAARRRRGRPRAYDPEAALRRATQAFWTTGYSATTLDDLAAATGMNRPSLYAAFGDKRALYLKALERYWQLSYAGMHEALAYDRPLDEALMRVFHKALSLYFPTGGAGRGCFAIGTATTEAVADPKIRAAFAEGLRRLDASFEERIRVARDAGELGREADPAALAKLASATLHTIALRARAGMPRAELEELARQAVTAIIGKTESGIEPNASDARQSIG